DVGALVEFRRRPTLAALVSRHIRSRSRRAGRATRAAGAHAGVRRLRRPRGTDRDAAGRSRVDAAGTADDRPREVVLAAPPYAADAGGGRSRRCTGERGAARGSLGKAAGLVSLK